MIGGAELPISPFGVEVSDVASRFAACVLIVVCLRCCPSGRPAAGPRRRGPAAEGAGEASCRGARLSGRAADEGAAGRARQGGCDARTTTRRPRRFRRCSTRAAWPGVNINPESRVKVARGPAAAELVEQGWRVFLVKVHNEGGRDRAAAGDQPQRRAAPQALDRQPRSRSRRSSRRMCPTAGWTS